MKIRTKINASFFVSFLAVFLLAGMAIGLASSQILRNQAYAGIKEVNTAKATQIKTFLNSEKEIVSIMAASTVFRDFLKLATTSRDYVSQKDRVERRLDRSIESVAQINEFFIIDKYGQIIVSTNRDNEGLDHAQDTLFTEGQKGIFIKDFYYSDVIKRNTYALSAPVLDDKTGQLLGVVVMRMKPDNLYSILTTTTTTTTTSLMGQTGETFLVNKDRYFITPSRFLGEEVVLKQKVETQNVTDCFEHQNEQNLHHKDISVGYIDYRGVSVIGVHDYLSETGWCLITKVDQTEAVAPSYQLLYIFILIFLVAVFLFYLTSYLLSRRIVRPINSLAQGVELFEKKGDDLAIKDNSKDEVGILAQKFSQMIKTVKRSRAEIEKQVEEQTYEIKSKADELANQRRAILNVLEDVNAQKNTVELLSQDLEKFKLAVENASDHIVITDKEGVVLFANKGVEKITGFKNDEVVGKKAGNKETWGGQMDLAFYQHMWDIIKNQKQSFIGEMRNKRKNGEVYDVFASISPILDDKVQVLFFVGIERDITKEKEIDKVKTEFVSLASHQLRTPLSAINWYAEMLLNDEAGNINEQQRKYLQEIQTGNKRMVELVNALLNVSRLELGTFAINPEVTDVLGVIKSLLKELQSQINAKNLQIKETYDSQTPKEFIADPDLLRVVLQNLLSNAVKYTMAGGQISIASALLPVGQIFAGRKFLTDSLTLTFTDTGMGIPVIQQDKIFSKLFRADNARKLDAEGTGLGLYIVKSIVDQSGGEVWFESTEGKGTSFYLVWPVMGMKKREGSKKLT